MAADRGGRLAPVRRGGYRGVARRRACGDDGLGVERRVRPHDDLTDGVARSGGRDRFGDLAGRARAQPASPCRRRFTAITGANKPRFPALESGPQYGSCSKAARRGQPPGRAVCRAETEREPLRIPRGENSQRRAREHSRWRRNRPLGLSPLRAPRIPSAPVRRHDRIRGRVAEPIVSAGVLTT
jgi:hypothetical protein